MNTGPMTAGNNTKFSRANLQCARMLCVCVALLFSALFASPARTQDLLSPAPSTDLGLPPQLHDVGFRPVLNAPLPLDAQFRDEDGKAVRLGDYFHGKPVILVPVYYRCPLLCSQTLQGVVGSLKMLSFNPGQEFEVVVMSFDPRETPNMALTKKQDVLSHYRRPGTDAGWHFLTGDQADIRRVTDAARFYFVWDAQSNMWAHASGVLIATPEGRISRYFYGIEYSPRDVRWGLIEASHDRIGTPVDQVLLFCYHYNPATGKYGALVERMLRIGGTLTLLGLALLIYVCIRKARHAQQLKASGA